MKKLVLLGIVAAVACAAYAYPTLGGPSGLLTVPDAAVTPAGQIQVAADLFYANGGTDAALPVRALYGFGGNFEFGAVYTTNEATDNDAVLGTVNSLSINAKYKLPFELMGAGTAVGASFTDPGGDFDSFLGAYAVATKALGDDLSGSAALVWNNQDDADFDNDGSVDEANDFSIQLGADAKVAGLDLILEYVNALPGSSLNMAVRAPITDALSAQLGFVGNTSMTTLGLNYAFGAAE